MNQMAFTCEFLLIIDKANNEVAYTYCHNAQRFGEFLHKIDQNISVTGRKLDSRSGSTYGYRVHTETVPDKEERFFFVSVTWEHGESGVNDKELAQFTKVLRSIKKAASTLGLVTTLRDDISLHYASMAYKEIHQVENLLRKLITYFMLTKVGLNWEKVALPDSVKQIISNALTRESKGQQSEEGGQKQRIPSSIDLVDFIVLSDYLFKEYPNKVLGQLATVVKSSAESIPVANLEDFLPKSNWERYFSTIVQYEGKKLQEDWEKLYALRNRVAHNRAIDLHAFTEITRLCATLKSPLQKAIDELHQVEVPVKEREHIIDNLPDQNTGLWYRNLFSFVDNFNFSSQDAADILIKGLVSSLPDEHSPISTLGAADIYPYINRVYAFDPPSTIDGDVLFEDSIDEEVSHEASMDGEVPNEDS